MLAVTVLLLLIGACQDGSDAPSLRAEAGPVPPAAQRPGDPELGYEIISSGRYMTCGMPYSAWRRAVGPQTTGEAAPPARADAALPYYMSRSEDEQGVAIVNPNCLLCHGGVVNGEVVVGLGNETLDFTDDPRRLADAVGNYVAGAGETAAWRKWADRIAAIAPYMTTDTSGVNPAPTLTLALIAHRDRDSLAWSNAPLLEPPRPAPLPVSVPPWWRMSKKHAMFYNAMGRGDHARFMMMKSLVCTDTVDEARRIDEMFTHVRAYIASLEPPRYPYDVDDALAEAGEAVFDDECAACHGTYGPDAEYPNRVVELADVGTDPAYAESAYYDSDRFMAWFNGSWYGELAEARPALGYIAPPLDGVWATAPFLHNGSVPTLEALLDSAKRPTYWSRSSESTELDRQSVGWRYRELGYGKEAAQGAAADRIYDTTLYGYSNAGHTFGDDLTAEQRRALIEYLKTL